MTFFEEIRCTEVAGHVRQHLDVSAAIMPRSMSIYRVSRLPVRAETKE